VKASTVEAAEAITGVDFHAEDEAAIANGLNQRLRTIQQLRQSSIPLDTEPAIIFKPALAGKEPKGPATPHAAIRYSKPPLTLKRPADLEEVAFWPVTKLAALIERRLVTSTELTKMYLGRLKRYQPTLNFYVTLTEDLALTQAAEADREIKAGKYRGPLHGLPWGAKDLLATKGIRTTFGGEPFVDQIIDTDATVVERLREAGAVLVAKLSLGALAQGDQWFGGRTNNPWNPQQGSSGSSAGPGSATAAGCVAFAIGTETRGSIISPSSVNGVVGLRPTYGRVSRYGAMALSNTMDKLGPMCRYVEDTVLVLNAIYGPDKHDVSVADAGVQVESGFAALRNPDRLRPQCVRRHRGPRRRRCASAGGAASRTRWRPNAGTTGTAAPDVSRRAGHVPEAGRKSAGGGPADTPLVQSDRIHSGSGSGGQLRRAHPIGRGRSAAERHVAEHVAQYLQDRALHFRGGLPARAAGPHDPDAADGSVHEHVRRAAVSRQRCDAGHHQPDGPPRPWR
jgi:hypothetical protein